MVGTALIVERIYWGGQFALGEGVREAWKSISIRLIFFNS